MLQKSFTVILLSLVCAVCYATDHQALFALHDQSVRVGAQTCGDSNCHASIEGAWAGSPISQLEFVVWKNRDRHSQAYQTLLGNDAKKIARRLSLAAPHQSSQCLTCHSDYVSKNQRTEKFKLSDGVGCEACHGGAKDWLGLHSDGSNLRSDHLANGMFPTENAEARTRLCLRCHSTQNKNYQHKLLAAGHPRLRFDIDTYTTVQPAHFLVDTDYVARKGQSSASFWALGQLISAITQIDSLVAHVSDSASVPEFSLFGCQSCHRDFRRSANVSALPGYPELNTTHINIAQFIASVRSRDVGKRILESQRNIQTLYYDVNSIDEFIDEANGLKVTIQEVYKGLDANAFKHEEMVKLLSMFSNSDRLDSGLGYLLAEQYVFAIAGAVDHFHGSGYYGDQKRRELDKVLEGLYREMESVDKFKPATVRSMLQKLVDLLR